MTGPLYPSYVDFDQFIDVARLCSLGEFVGERIEAHIRREQDSFFLNQHRLDESTPYEPGVREIWLSRTRPGTPYDYLHLDRPELWEPTAAADEFAPLMDFVHTLPLAETGRILIIYDNGGNAVPAHRDHVDAEVCNEFVWMRTNLDKQFYVLNSDTDERRYVKSYSAWFDSVNQYHGADAGAGLTFSIRVDGIFSDHFRAQIPYPASSRASTAALWAASAH